MYNRTILMGRIASDLELKKTPNGVSVCTFRIAVDRRYQTKDGERKTDFFNITAWRGTAEFITQYFGKGAMIFVEGELQSREYTDKSGKSATWIEVVVDQVSFTGEKRDGASQKPTNAPPAGTPASYGEPAEPAPDFAASDGDNYPF